MDFSEYVEENVLAPCGMSDSGYFAADRLPGGTAYAYVHDEANNTWRTNFFAVPIIGGPDGGAYTTAPDMVKLWEGLFNHRLLSQELTEKLLHPHIAAATEGGDRYYGYGIWMIERGDAVVAHYVEGWDPGVAFISAFYPGTDILITIIGNTNKPLWPIHDGIVSMMIK
jgi:CubicO group peptidase (beta-lactamase class C family)